MPHLARRRTISVLAGEPELKLTWRSARAEFRAPALMRGIVLYHAHRTTWALTCAYDAPGDKLACRNASATRAIVRVFVEVKTPFAVV